MKSHHNTVAWCACLFVVLSMSLGCSSDQAKKAKLLSIQVTPETARIAEGETKKFNAIGTFDDLSTRDISAEVVWSSSNKDVATITTNGVATGVNAGGSTYILATAGTIVSDPPAVLEVVDPSNRLVSIQVEPTVTQIQIGASKSFVATGTYLDDSTRDVTEEVIWETSDPTVVSVSNAPGSKGLAIGHLAGSAQISARLDDIISDPASVTVTEVALESISITPLDPTLPLGTVLKFKATGTYSDHSTADLTRSVTWSSSNPLVADFSEEPGEQGYCSGSTEGTTTVTAIMGVVISNPVTLSVSSASLQEIAIQPAAPSVPLGTEVRFSATGTYSDGQVFDLTDMVTWHSSDENAVVFDLLDDGLAVAQGEGSSEIWADLNDLESNHVIMTVTSATLVSIELSSIPANPVIPVGQQIQFVATGHYSDQDTEDITAMVTWDSSDKSVATISNAQATKGLAMGLSDGTTTISAALGGITGEMALEVRDIAIVSMTITPTEANLPVGEHLQYTAMATYNDSSEGEVTGIVTWHVGNDLVAAVGNADEDRGLVTAVGLGNTIVWCVSPNQVSASPVPITVTSATLSSIDVTSDTPSAVLGDTVEFTATGHYTDGEQLDLTAEVLWDSSDPAVATVSNSTGTEGYATTLTEGVTYISASKNGIDSNSFRFEVVAPSLESIIVTPTSASISAGETVPYTATGHYSDNQDRPITGLAYWQSSDTGVATISNAAGNRGEALGISEGLTYITASYQGIDSPQVPLNISAPVNQHPVAVLSGDATAVVNTQASFSGSGSYDNDGSVVNYTFNFGDGSGDVDNGSNPEITHLFTAVDTYTVVLTVTDDLGATNSDTMQIAVTSQPNLQPHAVLICPSSGQVGQMLEFDASNSYDDDGTITNYTFNFQDGSGNQDNGINPLILHSFALENTYTVQLIVTDDQGAQALTSCPVPIGSATIPEVRIIRPQGTEEVTQEQTLNVLVDANGQGGFSVTRVVLLADGVEQGEDTTAPYEFDYSVPASALTNSTITLQAQAFDNNSPPGMGQSQPVFLAVKNYPPVADFTATISDALQVTLDASSCSDNETDIADLEVRWDFESDGSWDEVSPGVTWSTNKLLTHTYPLDGSYSITMEVRDSVLQTDSTTRTVDLASTQTVGGEVLTTTWYGTIIVTGSVTVPAGEVLTINPGTQILLMYLDQNSDGIGDFGITVNGEIHVNGTDEQPVLFSMYGSDHKEPGAWQGILVTSGGPSSIDHAIVEYANIGLEIRNNSTVSNSTFRFNKEVGLYLNGAANASLTNILSHDNVGEGLVVVNSTNASLAAITCQDNGSNGLRLDGTAGATLDTCLIAGNGADGIDLIDSSVDITDCTVNYNHGIGVLYRGESDGSMTQSTITYNDDVGIRAESTAGHPNPVINYNNIYGNSIVGSTIEVIADPSATLDLSGPYNSGYYTSNIWSSPSGGLVRRAYLEYFDNYNCTGYLLTGSSATIATKTSSFSGWVDAYSAETSDLRVALSQGSTTTSNYNNHVSVTQVEYTARVGSSQEMTVSVFSGHVNARYNYWGIFPNVLDHISYNLPGSLDIQGFVGQAFDQTWDTGPYKAGDLASETWSGTIYITGDTNLPVGETLTVEAGTQILFVPVDQDFDGVGDYGLYAAGTLQVNGTSGNRVVFTTHGSTPETSSFDRVRAGGTCNISFADFTYGYVGLEIYNTACQVDNSNMTSNQYGLLMNNAGGNELSYLTLQNNDLYGLFGQSSSSNSLDHLTIQNNPGLGLYLESSSDLTMTFLEIANNMGGGMHAKSCATSTLQDSDIHDNAGSGLVLENTSWDVDHCAFLYNGAEGIRYAGNSSGTMTYSNVKFNDLPGILVVSYGSPYPQPAISYCNVYGNSLVSSVEPGTADPSGTLDLSGPYNSGYYDSNSWSTPNGQIVIRAYLDYFDNYNCTGYLLTGGGSTIVSKTSTFSGWVDADSAATSDLKVSLSQGSTTTSNYNNHITVTSVELLVPVDPPNTIELTTGTTGGQVGANHVYWGQSTNVFERISMSRPDAVDFTSWELSEVTPCGPR